MPKWSRLFTCTLVHITVTWTGHLRWLIHAWQSSAPDCWGTSVGLSANAQPFSLWPFCIKWTFISCCWVLRGRKWKLLKLLEPWFWRFPSMHYTADKSHSCQTELKGRSCELRSREVVKTYKDSEDWRQPPSRETPSLYVQTSVIPITLFMKGWSPFKNPVSTVNLLNMTLQKTDDC